MEVPTFSAESLFQEGTGLQKFLVVLEKQLHDAVTPMTAQLAILSDKLANVNDRSDQIAKKRKLARQQSIRRRVSAVVKIQSIFRGFR